MRSKHDETIFNRTRDRIQSYVDRTEDSFLKGPAQILCGAVTSGANVKDRNKALNDILMDAAIIAKSLWTQRAYFETLTLQSIQHRRMAFTGLSPF
jgi:hypothetical protein